MSEFQREHRYWVIKRKHLTPEQDEECRQLCGRLRYEGVPTTSLARLKAEWQAEALESLKDGTTVEYGTTGVAVDIGHVLELAAQLRRQAGAGGVMTQRDRTHRLEREHDRLKGKFHGCPYHGDDYEACIEYSGRAPCDYDTEAS